MLAAEIAMATDMTDIRVYAHWPGMTEPEWNAMETATRAGNSFSVMASSSGFTWSFRSTAAKYFEYCKVAYLNSHLDLDEKTKQLLRHRTVQIIRRRAARRAD
jgi:hypothetical protein